MEYVDILTGLNCCSQHKAWKLSTSVDCLWLFAVKYQKKGFRIDKLCVVRETASPGWGLTLWNTQPNFPILHGEWGHFMTGEGSISYAIEHLRILLRLYHEAYIMFPCYEQSQSELQHSPGKECPHPPSFLRLGILKKMTSLRQPADFHPGERNERNALMCRHKQVLCVCLRGLIWEGMNFDNQGDSKDHSSSTIT